MKRLQLLSIAVVVLLTAVLAGCNTMAGAGQDLQAGGKALTKSADDNK